MRYAWIVEHREVYSTAMMCDLLSECSLKEICQPAADAAELREAILEAARGVDAIEADSDAFGRRFVLDFALSHRGRAAEIQTAWIVRHREDFPRLTSCYVL